jgi:tripartite-type tricarboxylate transporter receptor subunit TctC
MFNLFIGLGASVLAATLSAGVIAADEYPLKPVSVIVPFAPAGVADLVGRPTAEALSRVLKQPFVINNRAGAGGATGNALVANAKPDGYTLLITLASVVAIPEAEKIGGKPPSYRLDQLLPIALMTSDPSVMLARGDSPWKSVQEFVSDAKSRPGKLTYSSSGVYGNIHIAAEMFGHAADIKFLHIPYSGGGPANAALVASQVDFTLAGLVSSTSFIKAGKMRPLAVFGTERLPTLPQVPTLKELGYDVQYYTWCGLFAPAGMPAPIVQTLREAMRQVVRDAQFIGALEKMETPVFYLDAPEFQRFLEVDAKRLAEAIHRIGRLEATK